MGHAMPPSPPTIEISIASRGISKGLSQTRGPQAVVRAELPIGPIYVAAYAKNVTSTIADGEGGLVARIRTKVAGLNVSASADGGSRFRQVPAQVTNPLNWPEVWRANSDISRRSLL